MLVFKYYAVTEKSIVWVFRGALPSADFVQFSDVFATIIWQYPRKNHLFDFTDLRYIDETAIRDLLALHDDIAQAGGRMAIAKANDDIYTKLYLSGADLFIAIYDSFIEALAENQSHYGKMPLIHPSTLQSVLQ